VNMQPTISVVTPSFNQVAYLESTMRSVIEQEYPGLEYVVIDGGSTDGSVEAIRKHQKHLSYWVSEADGGHSDALNKGFARTSGNIMCWINSSDIHYPWTLATVAEVFSALPQVEWITGIPTELGMAGGPRSVWPAYTNIYDVLAGSAGTIQQESVFWRRSLWDRAGATLDQTLRCAGDFDLWLRFFRLAPLYHVQTVLGGFRVHGDRLADVGDGLYEREMNMLCARMLSAADERTRRRARMVRALGTGRGKFLVRGLEHAGIWTWYKHPRIVFDFELGRWVVT
jgi:hypothetical protein